MSDFRITLQQLPQGQQVYFPGQSVSGTLELDLSESKSYNYIQVQFNGKAHVHWTETRTSGSGENQTTETVSYSATEEYVNQTIELWNKEQTPHGKIGPGMYKYPFQFTVPPDCPSSFKGSVGRIEYKVLGVIGTGLLKFNRRTEAVIQICQAVDNNMPQFLSPVQQTKHKQVGCLCCVSGNIDFTVNIPRTGYCIGSDDRIFLSVTVENGSGRDITMTAAIVKHVVYFAEGNRTGSRKNVAVVKSEQILRHSTYTWNPEDLIVPAVETTLTSSRIIKIEYTLKVSAAIPYAINPSIDIPIHLGNVPQQNSSRPIGFVQEQQF